MGCPTEVKIGDNLVFSVTTHDPDTGVVTDAGAAPDYRVYEDVTGTAILSGTMSKLDDANTTGFYTALLACTAANGFENGKTYTIYIEATVDSDKGAISYGFKAYTVVTIPAAAGAPVGLGATGTYRYIQDVFLEVTGRADLNQDANKWMMEYFINAGQRFLDDRAAFRSQVTRYLLDIATGQTFLDVKGARIIHDVAVFTTDDDRVQLIPKTMRELTDLYPNLGTTDAGQPVYYALNPPFDSNLPLIIADESIADGDFSSATKWTLGTNWTIATGVAVHNGTPNNMSQIVADQDIALEDGEVYRVEYDLTVYVSGAVRVALGITAGELRTKTGHYVEELVCRGGLYVVFQGYDEDENATVSLTIDNVTVKKLTYKLVTTPDWAIPGSKYTQHYTSVAIAPAADRTYTIELVGKFYSTKLFTDSDVSWWTQNMPDTLVKAAAYKLEQHYRNTAGANDWLRGIDTDLEGMSSAKEMSEIYEYVDKIEDFVLEG